MVRHTGEDIIDAEGVAIASVFSFQSPGIESTEPDTPQANRLPADIYASFGQQILDITVAQIESAAEPDGIGDDVRWGGPSRNRCRL